jgi:hypothetical protein
LKANVNVDLDIAVDYFRDNFGVALFDNSNTLIATMIRPPSIYDIGGSHNPSIPWDVTMPGFEEGGGTSPAPTTFFFYLLETTSTTTSLLASALVFLPLLFNRPGVLYRQPCHFVFPVALVLIVFIM